MLRPAAAYETVLMEKFKQHCYDEDMIYYAKQQLEKANMARLQIA